MSRKLFLKTVRPLYNLARKNPVTAHMMFATLEATNEMYDHYYRGIGKEHMLKAIERGPSFEGKTVIISVAFNNALLIEKQISEFKKFGTADTVLVIADNSSKKEARHSIAALCAKENVFYIDLPKNPRKQPNLSHSITLNWLYYNFIMVIKPYAFGFIDHDVFPTAPIDVTTILKGTPLYGLRKDKASADRSAWYLWAGFCFFRFDTVKDLPLNFSSVVMSDWTGFLELDTGGGNYPVLYQKIPLKDVHFAKHASNESGTEGMDNWQHLQKSSFRDINHINQLLGAL